MKPCKQANPDPTPVTMRRRLAFSTLLVVSGLAFQAQAIDYSPDRQWDRSSAMAAVRSVNIDIAVKEIGDISSLADAASTLNNLKTLETRNDWPLPAREAVVYQFTRSLAELPRDAVAAEVMQYLHGFQARVLVPHEDHGGASVPLFNVRGAAAGVENGWQRTEFATEAATLLATEPEILVSVYAESTNHNQRSGYLDALRHTDMETVEAVQRIALERPGGLSGLGSLLGLTTTITTDTYAIEKLLINGRGAGLSSALVNLDKQLQASETATLLAFAIQQAPAGNATLAIAAWWPRLRHDPATRDLMVDLLADPVLATSAALALAQSPDIQTIRVLQQTANGESSAARYAQMALDFNRDQLIGEPRP